MTYAATAHRSPHEASFRAAASGVTRLMAMAGIASFFCISPSLLFDLGFNYSSSGGNILEKIHPGTWLLVASLLLAAIGRGNPLRLFDDFARSRALMFYLFGVLGLILYTAQVRNTPFTPWIDTFLMPALVYVAIAGMSASDQRRLALVVHALLTANALLGIYEFLTGYRFTTYAAGEFVITTDWRSTALLGHPLAGALASGGYIVALALGGGRDLPRFTVAPLMLVQFAAMMAFGGRSSLVLAAMMVLAVGGFSFVRFMTGRRINLTGLGVSLVCAPILAVAIVYVAELGFFDRMLDRFTDDQGSANARLSMFRLFEQFSWSDLLFGPDPEVVGTLQYMYAIEYGIESLWLAFFLQSGILVSVFFFTSLFVFSGLLVLETRPATIFLWLYFYILASGSVSVSSKTVALGFFTAMILALMRRDRAVACSHPRTARHIPGPTGDRRGPV